MRRQLDYARPMPREKLPREGSSLARLALGLAIAVGVGQALFVVVGLVGKAVPFATVVICGAIAVVSLVLWIMALAFALAAWADRDGRQTTAAWALVVLAVEVMLPLALIARLASR